MSISNFQISDIAESRSDNRDLIGYRVTLDNKNYVLYYSADILKEVYFMSDGTDVDDIIYNMSVRTDMKTISHYYYHKSLGVINRYENNESNQLYYIDSSNHSIWCMKGDEKRVYTLHKITNFPNRERLYNDLMTFLAEFNRLNLKEQMKPDKLEEELKWREEYKTQK